MITRSTSPQIEMAYEDRRFGLQSAGLSTAYDAGYLGRKLVVTSRKRCEWWRYHARDVRARRVHLIARATDVPVSCGNRPAANDDQAQRMQ